MIGLVLTAACSSASHRTTGVTSASIPTLGPTPLPSTSTTSLKPQATSLAGHGLPAMVGQTDQLLLIDPATGEVKARGTDQQVRSEGCPPLTPIEFSAPTLAASSALSDLTSDLEQTIGCHVHPDGGVDAGYIDMLTGDFTNVSGKLPNPAGGFSATPTKYSSLGFARDNTLYFATNADCCSLRTSAASQPDFTPRVVPSTDPGIVNSPSKRNAFFSSQTDFALKMPDGQAQKAVVSGQYPLNFAKVGARHCNHDGGNLEVWVTDQLLMCIPARQGRPGADPDLVDVSALALLANPATTACGPVFSNPNAPCSDTYAFAAPANPVRPLLPPTTRINHDFVPAPDGSRVAFVSELGSTASIEVERVGTTPTEPTEVPSGVPLTGQTTSITLLRWQ